MGTPAPVGQTEPESEPEQQRETKKFAMTKSQRKYLTDLLHQNDIKDDALIGGFLKSIEDDAEQASQLIQAFTDKDFRAYEDWLFNRKPGACGGQEGLGLDK